jgi:hypothetical protein
MRDGARLSAGGGDIHHGAWRLGTFRRSVGSLLPIYACKLAGIVRRPAAAGTQGRAMQRAWPHQGKPTSVPTTR